MFRSSCWVAEQPVKDTTAGLYSNVLTKISLTAGNSDHVKMKTISNQAGQPEGSTTIPAGSTAKRSETGDALEIRMKI